MRKCLRYRDSSYGVLLTARNTSIVTLGGRNGEVLTDWPFDQVENVAAVSDTSVVENSASILLVVHYSMIASRPWRELQRVPAIEISAACIEWKLGF